MFYQSPLSILKYLDDLSKYKIIVENDASALMIRDDGVFIIPASTPGFLLVEFISKVI